MVRGRVRGKQVKDRRRLSCVGVNDFPYGPNGKAERDLIRR